MTRSARVGWEGKTIRPPMGFRAIDNKHLSDDRFNEPAYLRSPDMGLESEIGRKLDAALSKLYTWCSANNVQIMAHPSHSFGPNSDYEDRADPIFWANVLKQDAFPRLRINLAHFGHFNKAVQYARPESYVDKCWEWTIGKIICLGRTGNDFSYRPLPTFIDVAFGASILHGFVEVSEMSQVDAQPWKRILLENVGPEYRIGPILVIAVWPEAMAGMGHDWNIVRAAPRVKF